MPRLDSPQNEPDNINNLKSFRDRLMDRFAGHEWVRVLNVDDEPFLWQYMPEENETFEYTPDPMKVTRRGPAERYILNPGDSEVILGRNAYIMIEGLYKKLIAKKVIAKSGEAKPGVARSFNWTDPQAQEEWINKIYLGKEQPTFGSEPEKADSGQKTASPARKTV